MIIREELKNLFKETEENIFYSGSQGYWSNLNKDENARLLASVMSLGTQGAISKYHPEISEVIFSPKRAGGLELLDLSGDETCVDYGCMWGALTIPLAKRCKYVLGVDQTPDSLRFLKARLKEDVLNNVDLLCSNLKKIEVLKNKFDIAIVNGVLEWIPEEGNVELKSYFGKFGAKDYSACPGELQLSFLKKAFENLSDNGKLYLSIENRYDFKMFLGVNDPHANIPFASVLPRSLANHESRLLLGRPYVNWLYSFNGIHRLLRNAGFCKIDLYMCFPDYRFPERIIPYEKSITNYSLTISAFNSHGKKTFKRLFARSAEYLAFKMAGLRCLAPSIIAVAHKKT
jgi:hypothetical protein